MASTAAATDRYPSPVTPDDSEPEDDVKPARMAGRKRSASEMEEKDAKHKGNKKPPAHNKKRGASLHAEAQETIEAESNVDTTFTVDCPVYPDSKRYLARLSKEDLCTEYSAPSVPGAEHLKIGFSVSPGSEWSKLQRFKNAKFRDPVEVIYSGGQIVYVNRHMPVPPAPPADASDDEKLAFDKENLWVGLISEFRAASQERVYVRVFWLYWPDELPMGRQPYHGKHELVMSNHVDIIEAQSIASHAQISRWDENDDSNKTVLQERYWRQTYDLTRMPNDARNALSKLRRFCICGGYDNPSLDMYQCHKVGCGMWNHEACLIADIEERAWQSFKTATLAHEAGGSDETKSFTQKVADTVGNLVEKSLGKAEVKDVAGSGTKSVSNNKKAKAAGSGKKPWAGKLEGQITKAEKSDEGGHVAIVRQLVPTWSSSKAAPSFQPKVWNMELNCLRCHNSLN